LVISENLLNDLLNCVNILPLTSLKDGRNIYPNEALLPAGEAGITMDSIVLCHQIRTIDKRRLSLVYGEVTDPLVQVSVEEAIRFQFGL
jgi:Growth inhibitor